MVRWMEQINQKKILSFICISGAVFPRCNLHKHNIYASNSRLWEFGLLLLSEAVPKHNGSRCCFVYLVKKK